MSRNKQSEEAYQSPRPGMPIGHIQLKNNKKSGPADKFVNLQTSPRSMTIGPRSPTIDPKPQNPNQSSSPPPLDPSASPQNQAANLKSLAKVKISAATGQSYGRVRKAGAAVGADGSVQVLRKTGHSSGKEAVARPSVEGNGSGKRTFTLQQNFQKDAFSRVRSSKQYSKKQSNQQMVLTSVQKNQAYKSLGKGASKGLQNSNGSIKNVQVPIHILRSNDMVTSVAIGAIPQTISKMQKLYQDNSTPYYSNSNIIEQSGQSQVESTGHEQSGLTRHNLLTTQNLISQDISLQTLPQTYENSNVDLQAAGLQQQQQQLPQEIFQTQNPVNYNKMKGINQSSGLNINQPTQNSASSQVKLTSNAISSGVQLGGAVQYMIAPPISQLAQQKQMSPLTDTSKGHIIAKNYNGSPSGQQQQQLQNSMSWNMQRAQEMSPMEVIDLNSRSRKNHGLQDTLSKQIGSQTFAKKQIVTHANSRAHFGSKQQFQNNGIRADVDTDGYAGGAEMYDFDRDSAVNQQFHTTGMSIFDNTPLQEMPSVQPKAKASPAPTNDQKMPKVDLQQINCYADATIIQQPSATSQGIGFVNYVNGVPVSIQLNRNELMNQKGPGLTQFPKTSLNKNYPNKTKLSVQNQKVRMNMRSDLDKQIQAFNNHLYLQKQITQNLVDVQAKQGQYLPIIDVTGGVQAKPFMPSSNRPDLFRSNRKFQNLTVLRGIYDDSFQGNRNNNLDHSTFTVQQNPLRNSMDSPHNQGFSINRRDKTGSFSLKRSLKKRRREAEGDGKKVKEEMGGSYGWKGGKRDKGALEVNMSSNHGMKSPKVDSIKSRDASKQPINIEIKALPYKLSTAKAGSRQQHHSASVVPKVVGTSQALKRHSQGLKNKRNLRTHYDNGHDKYRNSNNTNTEFQGGSFDQYSNSGYNPSDTANNFNSMKGKTSAGVGWPGSRTKSPIRVQREASPSQDKKANALANSYSKSFNKHPFEASLFKMKVPRMDMEHLMRDDIDEMSKLEVIYKILKNQLRQHQQTLIKMRQQETKRLQKEKEMAVAAEAAAEAAAESADPTVRSLSHEKHKDLVSLKEFAKYMRPFEMSKPHREMSPELRRIVRNLTCQEHSYVYCPRCKKYEETEHDPMHNIKKFINYIKEEQKKLDDSDPTRAHLKKKNKKVKNKPLPDDSVSDITDLEEDEILAKYFNKRANKIKAEKRELAKQRLSAQARLLGNGQTYTTKNQKSSGSKKRHICRDIRQLTEEEKQQNALDDTVVLELRKQEKPIGMHDEDQSAHQFSVKEQSIQADSEERLDIQMQVNEVQELQSKKSFETKSPERSRHFGRKSGSLEVQSPERYDRSSIERKNRLMQPHLSAKHARSINLSPVKDVTPPVRPDGKLRDEFTLFKPKSERSEMAIQTDSHLPESRKGAQNQFDKHGFRNALEDIDDPFYDKYKHLDNYKEDWADSIVFKKAMKAEAIKRGLPHSRYEVEEEEDSMELQNQEEALGGEEALQGQGQHTQSNHEIGFLKQYDKKGNIQMLKESEVYYLKTLLKKDTEKWEFKSNLADIYRHGKFTIRMLTRKMARIENKLIFSKNKEINKPNTLSMIYRAEVLYSALGDAKKIFQILSKYIFDYSELERIQGIYRVTEREDYKFVKQREMLLRRLLSQITNFLSQYKIFNDQFVFRKVNIYEYLSSELEKVQRIIKYIDKQNGYKFAGVTFKQNERKKGQMSPLKDEKNGNNGSKSPNHLPQIQSNKAQNWRPEKILAKSRLGPLNSPKVSNFGDQSEKPIKSVKIVTGPDDDGAGIEMNPIGKPLATIDIQMNKTIE